MAWNVWSAGAVLAWVPLAMCGGQPKMATPPDTGAVDTGEVDDAEALQEVADAAAEELLLTLSAPDFYEKVELASGCETFKWSMVNPFYYKQDKPGERFPYGTPLKRIGEWSDPDPQEPWIYWLDMEDDGQYQPAGVGWLLTHFDLSEEPPDTFLGLPVSDLPAEGLAPSIPSQDKGYLVNGWLWKTHPDHELGWFGGPNLAMEIPSWYSMTATFDVWSMAFNRDDFGFPDTPGDCLQAADGDIGFPVVHPDRVGQLDPEAPDTVLVDHAGNVLGVQWTAPDDGSGAPVLHGQTFHGPDSEGNYVLRMWVSWVINTNGFFAETHAAFTCDEPFFDNPCWTAD